MNDWANHAAAKLRQQREDRRTKDQKFLEVRKLLKAKGAPLWREVKRIVSENAEALNKKSGELILRVHPSDDNALQVAAELDNGVRHLEVTFDEEISRVAWSCDGKSGQWSIDIENNGEALFKWGMIPTTPASMAKQMLDALLFD